MRFEFSSFKDSGFWFRGFRVLIPNFQFLRLRCQDSKVLSFEFLRALFSRTRCFAVLTVQVSRFRGFVTKQHLVHVCDLCFLMAQGVCYLKTCDCYILCVKGKRIDAFPSFLLSKERHIICMQRENVAETDFAKHKDKLLLILWRNSKYEGSLN